MSIYRAVYYLTKTAKDIYKIHVNAVDALVGKTVGSSADICYGLCAVREYDDIVVSSERVSRQDKNEPLEEYELSDDDIEKLKAGQKVTIQENIYYNNETLQMKSVQIELSLHSNYEKNRNYANSRYAKAFDYDKISGKPCIRKRMAGDRIVINREGNQRKLKSEFIDRKVPENMRDNVLLVCDDAGVLWAVGVRRSERALIDDNTQNVLEVTIQKREY